jgi:two-component system, NtrC family, sensor histidine kinase KinB
VALSQNTLIIAFCNPPTPIPCILHDPRTPNRIYRPLNPARAWHPLRSIPPYMFGLRQKLFFGFGGLLAILLAVSTLGVFVLNQHRTWLDSFLYENWRSVEYGQHMLEALPQLNSAADIVSGQSGQPSDAQIAAALAAAQKPREIFDQNVTAEDHNITLPTEDVKASDLTRFWSGYEINTHTGETTTKSTSDSYLDQFNILLNPQTTLSDRHAAYDEVQRLSPQLKDRAQQIINLNFENMQPLEGRIKDMSDSATRLIERLAAIGVGLAVLLILFMSRAILRPLQALTRSLEEISQGNLDQVVHVQSRDELRKLAEAFNSMASKLREFRRTDRAKLVRIQRTTQLAIDSLPDAVAVVNSAGTVEISNETAQKLFMLYPEQSILMLRDHRLGELYQQVVRDGAASQPRGYESAVEVYDQGGQLRFFLPRAIPIHDAERHLIGITIVLGDVTNLRRLDEMKSGLLSVVSHELKTPLTSIRMASHLLLEERVGPLNSKQTELLMAASEDADRLQKIIEDLLDMGRLESGRVKLDLQSEPSERLVSDAVTPMETSFHDKCLTLRVDVPIETPNVLADPSRIGHVFSNLLTNALKYTPPGGRVRISAEPLEKYVRFTVEDTGIGIPPEYLGRIFERFYRVPRENQPSGAGLGLAIAKEIVDAHGGTMEVESKPGQGSKFSFTLQRVPDRITPEHVNQVGTEVKL